MSLNSQMSDPLENWHHVAEEGELAFSKRSEGENVNSNDTHFYALRTPYETGRVNIPDDLISDMRSAGFTLTAFVDHNHPFYDHAYSMYGVAKSTVSVSRIETLEERGYEVEIKDDYAPFKFHPRPTDGQMVVRRAEEC